MAEFIQTSLENLEERITCPDISLSSTEKYTIDDSLPDGSFIYAKLDAVKGSLDNCTISDFFSWIGILEKISFEDALTKKFETTIGTVEHYLFNFNGCVVTIPKIYMYNLELSENIFKTKFPRIYFTIQGEGLDYLRSCGLPVDSMFRDQEYLPEGAQYTRMDFAFDFVNYKGDIVNQLIEYALTNHSESNRIILANGKSDSSLKYEILSSSGGQTFYLGTRNSRYFLRVYDKKAQSTDVDTGLYIKSNPYHSPDSWVRVELQCNKASVMQMAFGYGDLKSVLRFIYDHYKLADHTTPAHRREVVEFWRDFMNWDTLPPFIQNLHFVRESEPLEQRIIKSVHRGAISTSLFIAKWGFNSFLFVLLQQLNKVYHWEKSACPEVALRKFNTLNSKCKSLGINISSDSPHLFIDSNGNLAFKFDSKIQYEYQSMLDNQSFLNDVSLLDFSL